MTPYLATGEYDSPCSRFPCSDSLPLSAYGSGYPGTTGLGVANRGFPFVFWPLVWGGGLGYGAAYLHSNHEVSSLDVDHVAQ